MRRSKLTIFIGILAIFALASIGFASWIITNPNSGTTADGSIVVDDVTSEVFTIKTTWNATNGKILFSKPAGYVEDDSKWLSSKSTETENLEAELTISFEKNDNVDLSSILDETPVQVDLDVLKNGSVMSNSDVTSLFGGLTLPEPKLQIKSGSTFVDFDGEINFSDLDGDGKCVIKVVFSWGTATNKENPYVYYNNISFGTETTEEDADGNKLTIEVVAEKYLKDLYTKFTGISYKLTLSDK